MANPDCVIGAYWNGKDCVSYFSNWWTGLLVIAGLIVIVLLIAGIYVTLHPNILKKGIDEGGQGA